MKPVVNLEEKIGKTVGRRVIRDAFEYGMGLQKFAAELQESFGRPRFPKGAYKFNSFEEADAWMTKFLSRKKAS